MAAKLNVDEARNGEDNKTPVTNGKENTTQSQNVTPSGVPLSSTPDKTSAPDNLITEVSAPLGASNSGSEHCDGGVAQTPGDSAQTTTTQSLEPKSDGCNASTLRCGEKRQRESEEPSDVPVKRRLRPSEDSREESLPDYDVRCAELWIDGEMAACEAYELSKSSSNTQRQRAAQQNGNSYSANRPLTLNDIVRLIQDVMTAFYQRFTKIINLNMEHTRHVFNRLMDMLDALQRDTIELANEVRIKRAEERLALDTISLMNERMSLIERMVFDLHRVMITRK